MKKINKKFFIHSFLLHFLAVIFLLLFNSNKKIARQFIVFGAHSKKPTQAYFQPLKQITRSDWLKTRRVTQKKTTHKRIVKKAVRKKTVSKKRPVVKKIPPKSKPTRKTVIKKKTKRLPLKKAVVKKEISLSPKASAHTIKKIEKKIEPPKKVEQQEKPEKKIEQEELRFNLMGSQDLRLARYQRHIQKEVARLWCPPVGVPKGTECSLSFIINSKGKISKFEVIKRSKILIYDLSILRIAKNFKFDKCLWNKKFTIDFRQ